MYKTSQRLLDLDFQSLKIASILFCGVLIGYLLLNFRLPLIIGAFGGVMFMLLAFADFRKALIVAVFLLLFFPTQAYVEISRSLPIITVQRAVLMVIFAVWGVKMAINKGSKIKTPFIPFMIAFAVFSLFSVIFSVDLRTSSLRYLSVITEYFLLYLVIATSLKDEETINNVLFTLVLAVGVIAIIGVIEKRTGWSPVDYLPRPSREILFYQGQEGVISTTPGPIALGTVMVMAWPFALVVACHARSIFKRYTAWVLLPVMMLCLYYSSKRGPWLAGLITIFIMVTGSKRMRKKLGVLIFMGLLLISLRPGVIKTISAIGKDSVDPNSVLYSSYIYRFDLLRVVIHAISVHPLRTLFGFGSGASDSLKLVGQHIEKVYIFSDIVSSYIGFLLNTGVLGLFCMAALLIRISLYIWKGYKLAEGFQKKVLLASFSSIIAFLFQMINAPVYGWRQTGWLFWIVVGIAVVLIENEKVTRKRLYEPCTYK